MKFGILAASVATGVVLAAGGANAASIGLYNTGVDNGGVVQANGAAELHYSLVSVPNWWDQTGVRVATSANGYPIGPWLGDDSASAWIGPVGDSQLDGDYGVYDYQMTFSLTGLDASSASISGLWATDDYGLDILVNGQTSGQNIAGFGSFGGFTLNSGFQAGTNTLDFIVLNTGGPTGLRVEMSGDARAVPEPATWAMLMAGLFGMGLALRTRRKNLAATA